MRRAWDAGRRERKAGGVQEVRSVVVTGRGGAPFIRPDSYYPEFKRALKAWNPDLDWPPKDLRNCLLTFADDRGLRGSLCEEYTGHAVAGVSKKHYIPRIRSRSRGQAEALSEKMTAFRRLVVSPLEEAIREARAAREPGGNCNKIAASPQTVASGEQTA